MTAETGGRRVHIPSTGVRMEGVLAAPPNAAGMVLFAHGSGSSRLSPRNNFVAAELRKAGLGTLLMDLLTRDEDRDYETRFAITLLAERLADAVSWLREQPSVGLLPVGLFGASTGAAAALQIAANLPGEIDAVVSRGGRPDLAGAPALARVAAPTLLIVGGADYGVIELNQAAYAELACEKELVIVPHATHLFEEPGTLEEVARLAAAWFVRHLRR
ncbi:MAG: dienelactone hydrolase family protein [Burkholderiales bacterium]|nr:dienelactone hydrolase family protein [Burkholderiales bacterium]